VKDIGTHLALFLMIAVAIVTLGVFYAEAGDREARAVWPKRMWTFVLGCGALVAALLVCEHTFASLG